MDLVQIWEIGRDVVAAVALLAAGGGGIYVVRKRGKAVADGVVSDEWKELAQVRGQAIDDMEKRIGELDSRIAHLEGAYDALQGMKATEIADEVVARLQGGRHLELGI